MKELDLTQGRVPKVLLQFAVPFLIANVLQALYGGADLFVVGQYDDAASVAAVAIGSQVMQTITGIILGLTTGTTVLIAIATGARDDRQVASTIGSSIWLFALLGISLTLVMTLCHGSIASLMHTPVEAMRDTKHYILICSIGIPFIMGYNVICGILRGLGDSKYNERRSECEKALAELQKVVSIDALGDLTEAQFEEHKDAIKEEVCVRRAKHAVYENQRTIKAVEALKNNDVALFGKLMNESHVSLRDDYEVTGIELDTLVEEAWKIDGVIGSRMTGAGFGGCTVSIVKDEAVDTFIKEVGAAYEKKIGYAADFYVVEIGDGPVKLA